MIPVFEQILYPLLKRMQISFRPLQRMATGMALCSVSFILAGLLQLSIDMGEFEVEGFTESKHGTKICVAGCTNILWQVPQYIIITAGEIMFSITGLDFAYSQSPASMKSVLQSAWLLTVGNNKLSVVFMIASCW